MKNFLLLIQNRQFVFTPKIPYNLVAEPAEAGEANLIFPRWSIFTTKSEPILLKTFDDIRPPRPLAGQAENPTACGQRMEGF